MRSPDRSMIAPAPRGFSLVEVLLAILILGIGIISIAALFPAGIAQQRQAVEDAMGPVVANHALSVIRSKVRQEDFGAFEDFNPDALPPRPTLHGDWPWLRPGVFNDGQFSAVDIFSWSWTEDSGNAMATEFPGSNGWEGSGLHGIPFNLARFDEPPRRLITQEERYYPMRSLLQEDVDRTRPQYVWECMFRRYQGRVYVAVFVYRVSVPGGETVMYRVPQNPSNPEIPPLPIWVDLTQANQPGPWNANYNPDTNRYEPFVPGLPNFNDYNPHNAAQAWQEPRQWLLDQNMNVHRVVNRERDGNGTEIELQRPLTPVLARNNTLGGNTPSDTPYWYLSGPGNVQNPNLGQDLTDAGIVTDLWYIPVSVTDEFGNEFSLTPIYVLVREL